MRRNLRAYVWAICLLLVVAAPAVRAEIIEEEPAVVDEATMKAFDQAVQSSREKSSRQGNPRPEKGGNARAAVIAPEVNQLRAGGVEHAGKKVAEPARKKPHANKISPHQKRH